MSGWSFDVYVDSSLSYISFFANPLLGEYGSELHQFLDHAALVANNCWKRRYISFCPTQLSRVLVQKHWTQRPHRSWNQKNEMINEKLGCLVSSINAPFDFFR